ncbi:OmpA family protein [Mucilaginibacter sp. AW1-3]
MKKKSQLKLFNLKTMNYSTLKKTAALSIVSLMAVGAASAQVSSDTTKMASTSAKIFGGSGQYNTWTIGLNVGVTSNEAVIGGVNNYPGLSLGLGGALTVRKQLAHSFGIEADFGIGQVKGNNNGNTIANANVPGGVENFSTMYYSGAILGVINVATVDFLRRKNAINFFVEAGLGMNWYIPKEYDKNGTFLGYYKSASKNDGAENTIVGNYVPVGVGVKFRLSDAWGFNLGYNMNFQDADQFDGNKLVGVPSHRDKYTLGYAGLEWTLGSKSKPNLEWVNPVAMMYDELNDPTLRQEVEALKGRVSNVEKAVDDLKKDSDGDGVADQFDKCPNTPAGTVVDGSGCPLKGLDTAQVGQMIRNAMGSGHGTTGVVGTAYSNIQFEFDSSVLRTSSYPVLDATSADLRSTGKTVWVNGFASSEGTAAHNMQLSKDRANSVKTYLVNSGVDAKHIKVKGYGETKPIADNSTEDGRVLNRRVEFKK